MAENNDTATTTKSDTVIAKMVTNGTHEHLLLRAGQLVRLPKDVASEMLRSGAVVKPTTDEKKAFLDWEKEQQSDVPPSQRVSADKHRMQPGDLGRVGAAGPGVAELVTDDEEETEPEEGANEESEGGNES